MGILIPSPPIFNPFTNIRWNSSVLGVFFGPNPPPIHLVQVIVNSQWEKRDAINVQKTGNYYVFECFNHRDVDGLISQHTTIIEELTGQLFLNTSALTLQEYG